MRTNESEKADGGKERGLGATYYFYHNVNNEFFTKCHKKIKPSQNLKI